MKLRSLLLLLAVITFSCTGETKINLSGQHLTEVPSAIFNNSNLIELNLGSGKPIFLPPLSDFTDPNANNIQVLPDHFDQLTKLKILILNSNKFSTLPNSITKLQNLEVLDLAINPNLDVLKELGKLKQLKALKTLKISATKSLSLGTITLIKNALSAKVKVIGTIHEYMEESQGDISF